VTRATWILGAMILVAASVVAGSTWHVKPERPVLQGDYNPAATIKDLMDSIVDPSADDVWNAVTTTLDQQGTDKKEPRTDAEWATVRRGAVRLVESANLLMMPGRHMARPGEKSTTPGVELEPAEMETLVNQDRPNWNQRARALQGVALEVLQAVDARSPARLFDAGDRLDAACENCHRHYWYPNEKIPDFPTEVPASGKPAARN
jgi:hypothetical protein